MTISNHMTQPIEAWQTKKIISYKFLFNLLNILDDSIYILIT